MKPEGWPGWPGGKQFALVLTHDVETKAGLNRVKQLAELEIRLGFRSSFNFIPEADYRVSQELREWLKANDFEVGVHDLHHDGKLYLTEGSFRKKASKINCHLKDWNAVGFRSGFMLHRLDWLHDLNILYDSSTFDTDPYEPQPDGMGSIYPFWVPHSSPARRKPQSEGSPGLCVHNSDLAGSGYVELPYTLPQDSTLFGYLGEKTIDIWKRKLAWLADKGGMALLNTHPDYLIFDNQKPGRISFRASLYQEFLEYLKSEYSSICWRALPRDVATWVRSLSPELRPGVRRKACMLSYSFYESDPRVRRYAETLARHGDLVHAISLRKPGSPERDIINGVRVYRIQTRQKDEKSQLQYLFRMFRFLFKSTRLLALPHFMQIYDLIHVHNPPDFLAFAALLPKSRGAGVILDIHDIVPEFYANKFSSSGNSLIVKALKWVEKKSAQAADHVIVSNHIWHERIINRTVSADKASVFINHVDPSIFSVRQKTRNDGKFTIVFPGGLFWHQGVDIAIRAFGKAQRELPQMQFDIYGGGQGKARLVDLIKELGLEDKVLFHNGVPLDQVPDIIANADLGVVPKRADSFGNEAYSTKIMEFMSQGIPVIVSRTKIDSFYFNESDVCFFEPENVDELADRILYLARNREQREILSRNGLAYAQRNNWGNKKKEYLDLVDSIIQRSIRK
jgi:glycosyltransferase involved in cell wall biosynthesis